MTVKTDQTPKIRPVPMEFFDFAKGFAILSIVLFHYFRGHFEGWADHAVTAGGGGVHLFFILSGFGLAFSRKSCLSPLMFYKSRFIKVMVPYYIAITLILIINYIYPLYPERGWYAWLGHISLFKMFDERIINSFGGHFWFLSTIIQFYLAYPLLGAIQRKMKPTLFFMAALMISIFYWCLLAAMDKGELKIYNGFFLNFIWEFCGGMVLAHLYAKKGYAFWLQPIERLIVASGLGMALTAVMALKGGTMGKIFNDIPSALGITSLAALHFQLLGRFMPILKKTILYAGKISYELYLTHMLTWGVIAAIVTKISLFPMDSAARLSALPAACCVAWGYRLTLRLIPGRQK